MVRIPASTKIVKHPLNKLILQVFLHAKSLLIFHLKYLGMKYSFFYKNCLHLEYSLQQYQQQQNKLLAICITACSNSQQASYRCNPQFPEVDGMPIPRDYMEIPMHCKARKPHASGKLVLRAQDLQSIIGSSQQQ